MAAEGFDKRLEWLRAEVDVPADKIAELGGFARSAVGQYLRGEKSPSTETIMVLAEMFGVTAGWLAFGEGAEPRRRDVHIAINKYATKRKIDLAAPARFQREDG